MKYDENPYTNRKVNQFTTQKSNQKLRLHVQLQTDLGRSFGVTTVIQLVWLTRFIDTQPSQ